MDILIKRYPQEPFCNDFFRVVDFLRKYGANGFNKNWHWARWEWLLGHSNLDKETLSQIGMFEHGNEIIGITTHDMRLGKAYVICNPDFDEFKFDMLRYAEENLSDKGMVGVFIDDRDVTLINHAKERGFVLSDEREYTLALDCSKGRLTYELSSEFTVTDYSISKDLNKYYRVIWKGFNHDGLPPFITEDDVTDRPHENPMLDVFIVSPDKEYAAHCGTWYDPNTREAYVEPVVTIPDYRKRGLGKAVVYESINRCIDMGAKTALVISNQQFYHQIGFKEYSVHSLWIKSMNPIV